MIRILAFTGNLSDVLFFNVISVPSCLTAYNKSDSYKSLTLTVPDKVKVEFSFNALATSDAYVKVGSSGISVVLIQDSTVYSVPRFNPEITLSSDSLIVT